jgi:hypothetical protein
LTLRVRAVDAVDAQSMRDLRFCRKFCSGGHEGVVAPVCGED